MIVTPIEGEPDRFNVDPETGEIPWLVDLRPGPDLPRCDCAIWYDRTETRWNCKHVRAVIAFLRTCPPAPPVAVSAA